MLRRCALFIALTTLMLAPVPARCQGLSRPPDGDNQHAQVSQWIGLVQVTVDYHSPDVHGPDGRDRTGHIWGELVPYGLTDLGFRDCKECPWRAGANENTTVSFSHDVKIEGQPLAAGTYGLHMIPGKESWTIIFSRNSTSWGSFSYDPKEDALRVTTKPAESEYHEWLTYEFTDRQADRATCALKWEKLAVPFTIAVPNMNELYFAQIQREMRNEQSFTWVNWERAAQFCLSTRTHLDQGLVWAQGAVNTPFFGEANFTTLKTLAQLQIANGQRDAGLKSLEQAMATSGVTVLAVHQLGRELQGQKENELAMKVFQMNAKRFPNQWPVNLGLARAYAVQGDNAKAVASAKLALKQAPDEPARKNVENLIQQWSAPAAK
ncbi:MAG: DUF2911 domain-containing protein [Candidatus Eisenbacteria bacterium]